MLVFFIIIRTILPPDSEENFMDVIIEKNRENVKNYTGFLPQVLTPSREPWFFISDNDTNIVVFFNHEDDYINIPEATLFRKMMFSAV